MKAVAGATALRHFASAASFEHHEEASIVAELKAGSEDAYSWLIATYQPLTPTFAYFPSGNPAMKLRFTRYCARRPSSHARRRSGTIRRAMSLTRASTSL